MAVSRALEQQPTVRVIVSLREPPALAGADVELKALRAQVATRQARVLAYVPASEFEATYRYRALPALAGTTTAAGLAKLARLPDVASVTLDAVGEAALDESGPLIHVEEVHAGGVTGDGVVVAVLDSGIDTDHLDLASGILYEACYLATGDCPPAPHVAEDNHGHGTNVSGIITGDGAFAPRGIAPGALIAAYKVLDSNGLGLFSDWIAALDDIIANHPEVDIVNMSLQSGSPCPHPTMESAIEMLRARGTATFIAAGNGGNKYELRVPACIEAAISVGATYDDDIGTSSGWKTDCTDVTTSADEVACWSASDDTIDLLAPGAMITATGHLGSTSTYRGTSQAAPHVAGVAALLLEAHAGLSVDEIEARLKATGTLVTDDLDDSDPNTNRTTPRVDARVALLTPDGDADGDGCTNDEELGADITAGGRRNPLNPYDFYDVNGDGIVTVFGDILPVIAAFGPSTGPNDKAAYDRSPAPPGVESQHLGPPDGAITIEDIVAVAAQFGHRCGGP